MPVNSKSRSHRARRLLQPGTAYACRLSAKTCGDCFVDRSCFEFFLRRLLSRASSYRVVLHAYCLLPNAVLVLVTPHTPQGVTRLLASVAACYGRYFELRFNRSPQVFNPVPHCLALDNPATLVEMQRFIERVGIGNRSDRCPGQHQWSSYSEHALGGRRPPLILHPVWQAILPAGGELQFAYRELLATPLANKRYRQLQGELRISG